MTGENDPARCEVWFELTPADVAASFSLTRSMLGRKIAMIGGAVILIVAILTALFVHWIVALGLCLGVATLVVWGFPLASRWLARLNPHLRGPHTLWIERGGFGGTTADAGETSLRWNLLEGVYESPQAVLFQYRGGAAAVIPKRAFGSDFEAREFFNKARQWWRDATSAT
jgi:hypothetical protein